jgi:hypothetical protein
MPAVYTQVIINVLHEFSEQCTAGGKSGETIFQTLAEYISPYAECRKEGRMIGIRHGETSKSKVHLLCVCQP